MGLAASVYASMPLKPLDYICADIIKMWLRKAAQGKGGRLIEGRAWIKLSADDMLGYLEHRDIQSSYKQVQRSLKRIADEKLFVRAKLSQSRWDHSYWWSHWCPSARIEEEPDESNQKDTARSIDCDRPVHTDGHRESFPNTPPLTPASISTSGTGGDSFCVDELGQEQELKADPRGASPTRLSGDPGGSSHAGAAVIVSGLEDSSGRPRSSYERVLELAALYRPAEKSGTTVVESGGRRYVVKDGLCGPLR
ncbi:hypothetical protein CB0101_11240 [Synechococcus sp. CB0101]|uniref:hypothetical protein n=1 Tax=Synechococcus sp. CB0101 TaxID=232348 RepID=UPI0010AA1680|nr:hypothetical protein [Synechococcus sp. CB0101]QCH15420.1 hypothetical protein CB0101_11240 [Synechococcus sp. CB0101]